MSKDTPEVGDVFYCNTWTMKLIVTFDKYDMYWGVWETGQAFAGWSKMNFDDKTYLGKSKANIVDLFKTEND